MRGTYEMSAEYWRDEHKREHSRLLKMMELRDDAEDEIEQLKKQLEEQVVYGEYVATNHPAEGTLDENPSPELVAQFKADAVREYIGVMSDISNMCIGELAMNYKLDAQLIGELIYKATGKTNEELTEYADQLIKESKQ